MRRAPTIDASAVPPPAPQEVNGTVILEAQQEDNSAPVDTSSSELENVTEDGVAHTADARSDDPRDTNEMHVSQGGSERKTDTSVSTLGQDYVPVEIEEDSPEFRTSLRQGSLIDACDGDNMWYEARVESVNSINNKISVRFLGWSRKWNATLSRSSDRIAPRNSKVPDWRRTLATGKCVEVSSDSSTWCTAVVARVERENNRFQVIRAPACTTEWHSLDSPLIAEPCKC